jgi:hypothetical protein
LVAQQYINLRGPKIIEENNTMADKRQKMLPVQGKHSFKPNFDKYGNKEASYTLCSGSVKSYHIQEHVAERALERALEEKEALVGYIDNYGGSLDKLHESGKEFPVDLGTVTDLETSKGYHSKKTWKLVVVHQTLDKQIPLLFTEKELVEEKDAEPACDKEEDNTPQEVYTSRDGQIGCALIAAVAFLVGLSIFFLCH